MPTTPTTSPGAPLTAAPSPRQRLLDAADALFYARGIQNTGVDAVLARAEVARKTLYHQFGGKDGLVEAYLRSRDAGWRAHWARTVEARTTPRDRVLALFDALEAWRPDEERARGCAFHDALIEVADPDHPASGAVRDHWAGLRAQLGALVAATGVGDPEDVTDDVFLVYRGVLAAMSDRRLQEA